MSRVNEIALPNDEIANWELISIVLESIPKIEVSEAAALIELVVDIAPNAINNIRDNKLVKTVERCPTYQNL